VKILVLGVSGMLGNVMLRVMAETAEHDVRATARSPVVRRHFEPALAERIVTGVDVENFDALAAIFAEVRPDVVVNCIGLVKQLAQGRDPLQALPINSLLPHRLARLCALVGARLIHVSTDCVFSGRKGGYRESDPSDAEDFYGKSKFLGEVAYPNTITLRTSIIGHELQSAHGLIDWFLAQQWECRGYRRAIFSGVPTVILARIIRDVVIPLPELYGVYHVAAHPISKYELLRLVAEAYGKQIEIVPDDQVAIDRSLNAERFFAATGYAPSDWPELIRSMHDYRQARA
jgi:dTDP-4-dehydrorhamnose reductase